MVKKMTGENKVAKNIYSEQLNSVSQSIPKMSADSINANVLLLLYTAIHKLAREQKM